MEFSEYDRISDTVMFFDNNTILEFVVTLSSKDKNGNRLFFHSECDYDSNKYYGIDKGHSIKRRMAFYFVINDKRAFDRSFMITPQDAMMLIMIIEGQVLPWYFDSKRKIFSIVEGQLRITGNYQDIIFAKNEYTYLRFQPCIYTFEDNTYKEGIRMYVSSENTYVDMEIDKFLGFYYFISRTDMYSVATNLVTYAKTQPYGINKFSMTGGIGVNNKKQLDNMDLFKPENDIVANDKGNNINNSFFNRTKKIDKNNKNK